MEESTYRIASVGIITTLLDAKSKRRDSGTNKKMSYRRREGTDQPEDDFESCLIGKTIGYTRKGQVYVGQEQKKEYL